MMDRPMRRSDKPGRGGIWRAPLRQLLALAVTVVSVGSFDAPLCGQDAAIASSRPTSLEARSTECLFLVRYAEQVLSSWPTPDVSRDEILEWMQATRSWLGSIRASARFYHLDPEVLSIYEHLFELLDDYDRLLVHVLLVEVITEVARQETATFSSSVGAFSSNPNNVQGVVVSGAAGWKIGGIAGAKLGTLLLPGGGTVVLGGLGAIIGSLAGGALRGIPALLDWCEQNSAAAIKNRSIDEERARATRQMIQSFRGKLDALSGEIRTTVKLLAGPQGYNWGNEAGFDGTMRQPLAEQGRLRPRDPFVLMAMAVEPSLSSETEAIRLCRDAAALVPPDRGEVDVYDYFRADFLAVAARIAASTLSDGKPANWRADDAISCFAEARRALASGAVFVELSDALAQAESLAFLGNRTEAVTILQAVEKALGNEDAETALCLARGYATAGDERHALSLVERSFKLRPRWDPSMRQGKGLASLPIGDSFETWSNPLVGRWDLPDGHVEFFANGDFFKKTDGAWSGTYRLLSPTRVELVVKGKPYPYPLEVDGSTVRIGTEKGRYRGPSILGKWRSGKGKEILFNPDGTWNEVDKGVVTRGRFSVESATQLTLYEYTRGRRPALRHHVYEIDAEGNLTIGIEVRMQLKRVQ